MKKIILLLCLTLVLVGCNKNDTKKTTEDEIVVESIELSERPLIVVNGEVVTIGEFEKYYAKQNYDFEKEYGEDIWKIEKDGMTMVEMRQNLTIDYLIYINIIEDYVSKRGIEIDQAVIDEGYDSFMIEIEADEEKKMYYEANGIDETIVRTFLNDQYYLKKFKEVIYEDVSNNEETINMLFEGQVIRYKARHILLEDELMLSEVLALLNDEENPVDFSDMARLYSTHSTSAVKGGDLGYTLIGNMPTAFEDVALNIETYTVSEGVLTDLGYHIIFVDDRQMLSDMIELGMPEEEINIYKSEIIKRYADSETLRVFNDLKKNAEPKIYKELLNEEQE